VGAEKLVAAGLSGIYIVISHVCVTQFRLICDAAVRKKVKQRYGMLRVVEHPPSLADCLRRKVSQVNGVLRRDTDIMKMPVKKP